MKIKFKKNSFPEYLKALHKKYNIVKIEVSFSGSGDSGEIENPEAWDTNNNNIKLTQEEETTLDSFFSEYLDSTGYDWYNNDGGYGIITLFLPSGIISCEMNINVMSEENYSLGDDEFSKNYNL